MKISRKENMMKNRYDFKPTHFLFNVHGPVLNSKKPNAISRPAVAGAQVHATPRPNEKPLLKRKDFEKGVGTVKLVESNVKPHRQGEWRCTDRRNYRMELYKYNCPSVLPEQEWLDSVVEELEERDRIRMRMLLKEQNEQIDYNTDAKLEHIRYKIIDAMSERAELYRITDKFCKGQECADMAFLQKCYGGKIR